MISYKDRSFCADSKHCARTSCERNYNDEHQKANAKVGLPVSYASFRSPTCGFEPVKDLQGPEGLEHD